MELFPALLIGGPPHSGKSVLAYNLSQAFRQKGLQHYLLRACPDGEGDWSNEADQSLVRDIRIKGDWTPEWVAHISRDIARRHLPLLVDMGGKPQSWQEGILSECTHALLLGKDETELAIWQGLAERNGLRILGKIETTLTETSAVWTQEPVFKGRLAGLKRGTIQTDPIFEALVNMLIPYFNFPAAEIIDLHFRSAPVDTPVDLTRLARLLGVSFEGDKSYWEPVHLPHLFDYLPAQTSIGLYGRGPNWLYPAVALQAYPAPFFQFDVRLGWKAPPTLHIGTEKSPAVSVTVFSDETSYHLAFFKKKPYIDYLETEGLNVPPVPLNSGVMLSGAIPHWLYSALAQTYQTAPWIAIYQPMLKGAVVVASREGSHPIGRVLSTAAIRNQFKSVNGTR